MNIIYLLLIGVFVLFLFFYFIPIGSWMQAKVSGIDISLSELISMQFRNISPMVIVNALAESYKFGLNIKRADLEALYLSDGNLENVINGMIMAKKNDIPLSFKDACTIDRNGGNVIEFLEKGIKENITDNSHRI